MIREPNVKINLGLNVLRRRPDGFHDLETLFLPCSSYSDRLEIVSGDDWSRTSAFLQSAYAPSEIAQGISVDGSVMITIARREGVDWDPLGDLTVKACRLLADDFKLPPLKIFLEKRSPVGAGLGGGSSDAAFTLMMLNEMLGLGLTESRLMEYASRLGSDCAFFVCNRPMFGSGRGEVLEEFPLPSLDGLRLELVVPEGISVSTAEAYRGIVPSLPSLPLKEALQLPSEQWRDVVFNDFETTVFAAHPQLAAIKRSLYDAGAVYASMSGSGSALYGLFPV